MSSGKYTPYTGPDSPFQGGYVPPELREKPPSTGVTDLWSCCTSGKKKTPKPTTYPGQDADWGFWRSMKYKFGLY